MMSLISRDQGPKGFSLLEVILSLGIITTMSVFVIQMISRQIETRQRIEVVNDAHREVNQAMNSLVHDLQNAFLFTSEFQASFSKCRWQIPIFKGGEGLLTFMTKSYRSFSYHEKNDQFQNVLYETKSDQTHQDKKNLVRYAEHSLLQRIQNAEKVQEQVLINDLKEFQLSFWNGSDFVAEWDSEKEETKNFLPKMVKIRLGAWIEPTTESLMRIQRKGSDPNSDRDFFEVETIVYLPWTKGRSQPVEISEEYSWKW